MTSESTTPNSESTWHSANDGSPPPIVTPAARSPSGTAADRPRRPEPERPADGAPVDGPHGPRAHAPHPQAESIDPRMVDQTRQQIRQLVDEISNLAKSQCPPESFYQGFLTRTTSALACVGGVIWMRDSNREPLELKYQINLSRTVLADNADAQIRHHALLTQFLQQPEPCLIPPNSGSGSDQAGNPTEFLLILAPLVVDHEVVGILEILQRAGGGPATQRGYLRFVLQMAELASDYLKSLRLRLFAEQQQLWQQLDQFVREIHSHLDPAAAAAAVANEGRRLIGCDRLAVATLWQRQARIEAVSGLDTVERRAEQIKELTTLVGNVARTRREFWYQGGEPDLPPPIEGPLQRYLDTSHVRGLAIVPLFAMPPTALDPKARSGSRRDAEPFAALIIEKLAEAEFTPSDRQGIELVTRHASSALANAREHGSLFGLALWKQVGSLMSLLRGPQRNRWLVAFAALALVLLAGWFMPYPFTLSGQGELVAVQQHDVFAHLDGTLIEVIEPAVGDPPVAQGQQLARMVNNDLAVEIENLEGQLKQAEEDVRKYENSQLASGHNQVERVTIEGELAKAKLRVESTQMELELLRQQAELLTIRSPIQGHVVNWQLQRDLLGRPVSRGQKLMTVIAPQTEWQVELYLPEKRVGHLLNCVSESQQPLAVRFALASRPGHEFSGRLLQIDRSLQLAEDGSNACRLLIAFANQQVPNELLRAGTRVIGKIECGQRTLGYVWLRELIEAVQSRLQLWF